MFSRSLILFTAIGVTASICSASTVFFRIEKDILSVNGVKQTPANNLFIYSATAGAADLMALSFTTDNSSAFISQIENLSSNAIFTDPWVQVPVAQGGVSGTHDWNLARLNMTPGNLGVMLVLTSPIDSLSASDYVGLVASGSVIGPDGSMTMNFNGVTPIGSAFLGTVTGAAPNVSNFELQAIPEPSTYAAIFGLLVLGVVACRRRLSK
ncbi:MAG: PEP-CTERM sorting domain-containing protein [Verrucomicrobia bacterium]|nr:PEP-CTERM sorting domain-containing protein [Verrucomicrobiota bacterium]